MRDISLEDVERFVELARRAEGRYCDDPPGIHLAFHEAGHLVACQAMGIRVLEAAVDYGQGRVCPAALSDDDEAALSSAGPETLSPAQLALAARHLVVDHAGLAAQHELVGWPDYLDEYWDDESVSDEEFDAMVAEVDATLEAEANSDDLVMAADRARRFWPEGESLMRTWAENEALDIIAKNHRAVLAVAGALVELRHLDEKQIAQIFQILEPVHPRAAGQYIGHAQQALEQV